MDIAARLGALRQVLSRAGAQAFMLPVADEHLGEYVPDCARRLAWLTGFTGSAGLAVVLAGEAALFMDGRYTLQARDEAPDFTLYNSGDVKPEAWLASAVPEDAVVGFDPWLHSMREMKRFRHAAKAKNIRFTPLTPNPVDALWQDRPAPPAAPAFIHPLAYAGVDHAQKRTQAATAIRAANADFAVLAASDSINWLLNIRGHDLACSPVVLAYAIVSADGKVQLFSDTKKFLPELREHLGAEVTLHPVSALEARLADLRGRVLADPTLTPEWFAQSLSADIVPADDPCQRLKAIKNPTELSGMRAAHIRDGAAVVRLLHWLDEAVKKSPVSELEVVKRLHAFRAEAPEFVSPSFDTIAGSGPHAAIVHYRATQKTDRALQQGELFLLDSGGQYPDGTTDITRTVPIGAAGGEQRDRFTRVLKGHIALAAALFPEGTSGSQLDALARAALWQAGLDYDHGTGHGVG
ncbi:MAG: aminopeptidase P family N-terminal domain-containing protein, partial [Alphaproteobacteria bacterium]|nr:aminopeptidase P family N-terminal domain-containing protein [Alphaproteobacteria bacterium]